MKNIEIFIDLKNGESVSGVISGPDTHNEKSNVGIVFAHGAANDMDHPVIVAVSELLAEAGYITLRFNFLYREKNKKSPDPEHRLVDAWKCAIDYLRQDLSYNITHIVAAGKSLGGRIASQASASGDINPDALVFFGYPLHAPGRKDKLKDAHLYDIKKPMLFFEGTRDPFCDLEKFQDVFKKLSCRKSLEIIDGGNHSFDLPKSDEKSPEDVYRQIVNKCKEWIQGMDSQV